ncbi:hypothetical protein BJV78DRAFT_1283765 [Lactifluus subvellereus]|nr:hypothetical protein BJV78DRAFT_1283765 [Lactifluus subvellereus]
MKAKNPQDTLTPYFDNSVTAVQQTFARLEDDYVLPIWDLLRTLFLAYPIPFVFFSILVALSFFPVLAFIIVSAATLSTALTLAVCLAFVFSTGVFLFLGGILAATLGFALLLSGFLTTFGTCAYLSGRLVLLLHRSGRSGFRVWYQEVIHLFFPSSAHLAPVGEDLYTSEDSGILVGQEVQDGLTPKIEPSSRELPDSVLNRAG